MLCLDIEGGHGGSSRSLYESVSHLDRSQVSPEVWCRRPGPIVDRYRKLGVVCKVQPRMPKVSSLARLSRNLYVYAAAGLDFWRARPFLRELRQALSGFDLVHFNHEALFLLAAWLRPRTQLPFVMHIRTNLAPTAFGRWQERLIGRVVDARVFITGHEEASYRRLGGSGPGRVIFNIVRPTAAVAPHAAVPLDERFRVAAVNNYSWPRGTDRLIDVAELLARRGRKDVLFVMAGDNRIPASAPGELGQIGRRGGTLADYAAARGVSAYFLFLGHVDVPEQVLAACHVLAKPTREANPWGRDILEASAQARPVLSIGSDATFVVPGETGLLFESFDPASFADAIVALADDRAQCARLGAAAQARVLKLCDGRARAADLLALWQSTLRSPC